MTEDAKGFFNGIGLQNFNNFPDFAHNSDLTASTCSQDQDCEPLAWTDGQAEDIRYVHTYIVECEPFATAGNILGEIFSGFLSQVVCVSLFMSQKLLVDARKGEAEESV